MPSLPVPSAFTLTFNGRASEIISDVKLSTPLLSDDPDLSQVTLYDTKALWDTGATNSAITKETADKLGLKPISKAQVHHVDGVSTVDVYLADMYLPNHLRVPNVRMTECKSTSGKFGVLIGMDVITLGDFSITNYNFITRMSFRYPSSQSIDFVEQINRQQKLGRNDPCFCGSGKKFKNCHGK